MKSTYFEIVVYFRTQGHDLSIAIGHVTLALPNLRLQLIESGTVIDKFLNVECTTTIIATLFSLLAFLMVEQLGTFFIFVAESPGESAIC
jgi:hypothetical protein